LKVFAADEGGVFKSKKEKEQADEIKDDSKTTEEVPIDKREAETVEVNIITSQS